MADAPKVEEPSIIESLREQLLRAETSLRKPEVTFGELYGISNRVRSRLEDIYGKDSPLLSGLPARGILRGHVDRRAELIKRTEPLRRIIEALEAAPGVAKSPPPGRKI